MSIIVKLINGSSKDVPVSDFNITVEELKKLTAPHVDIAADEQRIVLRGKVLKDTDVLSAVGMESGSAIHVVRSKKKAEAPVAAETAKTVATPSTTSAASSTAATTASPAAPANPYASLFANAGTANATGAAPNPYAAMGGMGGMGGMGNPYGAPGGAGTPDVGAAMEMMQNPMMQQMMAQMMQNPQFMEQMRQSNPYLANMPPEMLQQTMQMMQNPEMMRMISGMYASGAMNNMGGMGGMDAMGGMGGMGGTAGGNANNAVTSNPNAGMGFNPATFAPPQPQGNPREIYREQLQQLREMGFPNEDANIAALQQSQGNVSFAIERLFNA